MTVPLQATKLRFIYFGLRVHGTVMHTSLIAGLLTAARQRLRENTFGVKLLHLFTIPFGVYEKDRQTQPDILPPCHGVAGASTQRFISHLEAK